MAKNDESDGLPIGMEVDPNFNAPDPNRIITNFADPTTAQRPAMLNETPSLKVNKVQLLDEAGHPIITEDDVIPEGMRFVEVPGHDGYIAPVFTADVGMVDLVGFMRTPDNLEPEPDEFHYLAKQAANIVFEKLFGMPMFVGDFLEQVNSDLVNRDVG